VGVGGIAKDIPMRERTRPTVRLQPEYEIEYHQWTWNSIMHANPKSEGQGVDVGRRNDREQGKGGFAWSDVHVQHQASV